MEKAVRKLSKAGGITIPKNMRRDYAYRKGDKILLCENGDGSFCIKKVDGLCMFCKAHENITEYEGRFICKSCLEKIKEKMEGQNDSEHRN